MNNKRKLYLFLLLLPIIDVLTSITEKLNLNIPSLGIIIKSVFLGIMILYLITSSTSKYKKMSLYYLMAIFLYMVLFFITKINYLNLSLFVIELKYMIKILFYPISLITMICYFDDKKLSKEERQNALESFRRGKIKILVSSDVSARGLDIPGVTHIINLDFPGNSNEYLHRAGRTARGNDHGTTISLVTKKELAAIRVYEREFKIKFVKKSLREGKLI